MRQFLERGVATALLFFFAALPCHILAQDRTWTADSIKSAAVGDFRNVRYTLPAGHSADSPDRLPVLYLLHGLTGDHTNWTERTAILKYLDDLKLDIVVVMPDADDSWYQNDIDKRGYFDFFSSELPAWAHEHLGADTTRQAVAGLSMGGYGALLLGVTSPRRYQLVGSFSGAIVFPAALEGLNAEPDPKNALMWSLWKAFGGDSHSNRQFGDLYRQVEAVQDTILPYIVLRHGIQDGYKDFLPGHRKLAAQLAARGWPYEYHELPGGHNWPFWDASIRAFLETLKTRWQEN